MKKTMSAVPLLVLGVLLPSVLLSTEVADAVDLAELSEVREMLSSAAAAAAVVEPPKRPASFRNLDALNQYITEMRQYYSIIGRPR